MFYPTPEGTAYGEKVDGSCNSDNGADGPIDGNKSPYDNIAFFITSPTTSKRFAIGNIHWADAMLRDGTSCFREKNDQVGITNPT